MGERLDYRCDIVGCRLRLRLLGVTAEAGDRVWAAAVAEHECVSPPDQWPPQIGDVWADREGVLWAVRNEATEGDVEFVRLSEAVLDLGADGGGARWFLTERTPANLRTRIGTAPPPVDDRPAEAARELMRDGAVRVVERVRLLHVRDGLEHGGGGQCRCCGMAWPCPTMTIVESVEPWATLARDGWQAAINWLDRRGAST